MDGGISRIRSGLASSRADRVGPRKDREREEQAEFAEELEHRAHEEAHEEAHEAAHGGPTREDEHRSAVESLDAGYRTADEAGGSLDIVA